MKAGLNCILVIDDDEPTNFITRMILEESGCTRYVRIVQSGREALNYLKASAQPGSDKNRYPCADLIFLDINMPAMNGWEFLNKYDELDSTDKVSVITVMLTTSLNPDDRLKADENPGISKFETKPLTKEKLERILQEYFPSYFLKEAI